jgi:hypothetical protein
MKLTAPFCRAEFPLQWLGECLINQSLLYEGNPDTTNIKERFRYQFDVPLPQSDESMNTQANGTEGSSTPQPAVGAASDLPTSNEDGLTNGQAATDGEEVQGREEQKRGESEPPAPDTEMTGTS